jgi:hypothetical protein
MLKVTHFEGLFEKIAQVTEVTTSSSSKSKSSSGSSDGYGLGNKNRLFNGRRSDRMNLQSTISKSREKADLQPLHKDTGATFRPADAPEANRMYGKQKYLGGIEDKRITFNHLRNR